MPANAKRSTPSVEDLARSQKWPPDEDLVVYAAEYGGTGFQSGLNLYRIFQGLGREEDVDESISIAYEEFMSKCTLFARKKMRYRRCLLREKRIGSRINILEDWTR